MPNTTILPQGLDSEADDVPKKFTNIDKEDFEFRWDSKPFGGVLPDRMRSWQEEIIDTDATGKEIGRRKVQRYEFLKPIAPNETVIMPKYLVNYAAMTLAKKMYKRDSLAEYKSTPIEERIGFPKLRDEDEEKKLQEKMVAENKAPELEEPEEVKEFPVGVSTGEKRKQDFTCEVCEFVAKSALGLVSHKRFKHKKVAEA